MEYIKARDITNANAGILIDNDQIVGTGSRDGGKNSHFLI